MVYECSRYIQIQNIPDLRVSLLGRDLFVVKSLSIQIHHLMSSVAATQNRENAARRRYGSISSRNTAYWSMKDQSVPSLKLCLTYDMI